MGKYGKSNHDARPHPHVKASNNPPIHPVPQPSGYEGTNRWS